MCVQDCNDHKQRGQATRKVLPYKKPVRFWYAPEQRFSGFMDWLTLNYCDFYYNVCPLVPSDRLLVYDNLKLTSQETLKWICPVNEQRVNDLSWFLDCVVNVLFQTQVLTAECWEKLHSFLVCGISRGIYWSIIINGYLYYLRNLFVAKRFISCGSVYPSRYMIYESM